jgi:small subunit ribosomal protein S8e
VVSVKLGSFYQGNDARKPSGGARSRPFKVKRKALGGGPPVFTVISGGDVRDKVRCFGGGFKVKLHEAQFVNLYLPRENRFERVRLIRLVDNPANREFVKKGIVTKGAIVETERGRAVVTSRPGQDGVLNAVLLGE